MPKSLIYTPHTTKPEASIMEQRVSPTQRIRTNRTLQHHPRQIP